MKLFSAQPEIKKLNHQITPVFYFGQRESIVSDLFKLLGKNKYQHFYDPFSGSGSVSFAAMELGLAQGYIVSDSFPIFRYLWELIKNLPQELINGYSKLVEDYCAQSKIERNGYYNQKLENFNVANKSGFYIKAAIIFSFLINFADKNTPFFDQELRLSTQANVFIDIDTERKNLIEFSKRTMYLSGLFNKCKTSFTSGDFLSCIETASKGDLVLMDPPYPDQAENVYFKLKKEQVLEDNLRSSFEALNRKGVDFMILYGARIVKLKNQFDEEKFNVHHLVRLSTHRVFGHFFDHIYISRNIPLTTEQLPPGMAFYHSLFAPNVEMTQESYDDALMKVRIGGQSPRLEHKLTARL